MTYNFQIARGQSGLEFHSDRRNRLLQAHPELRRMVGPSWITAPAIVLLVALQTLLAMSLATGPWWLIMLAAYTVGAVANLGCWALIHEGSHNLIVRSSTGNRWWSFVANLPILVPAAAHFRFWHRHHHNRIGQRGWDVDLPMDSEIRLVGNSPVRKAVWLALFMPMQVVRAFHAADLAKADRWLFANIATTIAYAIALTVLAGPAALAYLLLSSWSAMGLHPLGARWVQEHFTLRDGQETNSYYGAMNAFLFNCGLHNEHHDLPGIAWHRLPHVRRTAPEFYDGLNSVDSWTVLLWRFLTDRDLSLANRVIQQPPLPAASRTA